MGYIRRHDTYSPVLAQAACDRLIGRNRYPVTELSPVSRHLGWLAGAVHSRQGEGNSSLEVLNICGSGRIIAVSSEMFGHEGPWDLWMSVTVHNSGELTENPVFRALSMRIAQFDQQRNERSSRMNARKVGLESDLLG